MSIRSPFSNMATSARNTIENVTRRRSSGHAEVAPTTNRNQISQSKIDNYSRHVGLENVHITPEDTVKVQSRGRASAQILAGALTLDIASAIVARNERQRLKMDTELKTRVLNSTEPKTGIITKRYLTREQRDGSVREHLAKIQRDLNQTGQIDVPFKISFAAPDSDKKKILFVTNDPRQAGYLLQRAGVILPQPNTTHTAPTTHNPFEDTTFEVSQALPSRSASPASSYNSDFENDANPFGHTAVDPFGQTEIRRSPSPDPFRGTPSPEPVASSSTANTSRRQPPPIPTRRRPSASTTTTENPFGE